MVPSYEGDDRSFQPPTNGLNPIPQGLNMPPIGGRDGPVYEEGITEINQTGHERGTNEHVTQPTTNLSDGNLADEALPERNSRFYGTPYALPTLKLDSAEIAFKSLSNSELASKARLFRLMSNPTTSMLGQKLLPLLSKIPLLKAIPKSTIFNNFCGGEDINEAISNGKKLHKSSNGICSILDYSVEGEKSEAGFDATTSELLACIRAAASAQHISFCAVKITGIGDFDLLAKAQKEGTLTDPADQAAFKKIEERLEKICNSAANAGVKIFIDAEESWVQDTIDNMTVAMMKKYNKVDPIVFTTVQLYRSDRLEYLSNLIDEAKRDEYILALKTVRGAYLEKENNWAQENGVKTVIQPDKDSTDRDYDRAVSLCLDNLDFVSLFVASHNADSCHKAAQIMADKGISVDCPRVHFGQLLGMSDTLSYGLKDAGCNVSKYVPYGPLEAVVPYLLRRAKENTAIKGQTSRESAFVNEEMDRRKNG